MSLLSTTPAIVSVPGTGGNTYTATFKTFTNIASPGTTSDLVTLSVYYIDPANNKTVQVQKTDYVTKNPQAESIQIELQGKVAPVGSKITMVSTVPYTQVYSFPPGSPVDPSTLELALDRVVMMTKQNFDRLNVTVGLENPPANPALRLIVPEPIVTGNPVFWEQDPTNASRFYLRSAAFTIEDFQKLHDETLAARDQAVAAATAAQNSATASANSALASANSAASSAQTYADIQVYGTTLRADMETIKNDTEAIKDQAEVFRDEAADSAAQAEESEANIEDLVARFPTPVGQPINQTYVTDGAGAMTFQPYYPIIGMDTATSGQVITVQDGPQGKELIAASPITTSERVATFSPVDEGGVTVSSALMSHEAQINALNNTASIFAYGRANAVADFVVNVDGNLRSTIDTTVVTRTDALNVKYEKFGLLSAYYTSGNNFVVPQTINSRPLFGVPTTMMFGVYIDANMPDTVIFANNSISVKKVATSLQLISGTLTKDLPLVVNQWVFYCLIFNGTTLTGYTAQYAGGSITLTDIASTALPTAIVNADLNVNMETNLRLVRLTFAAVSVTKDQFDAWVHAIYGMAIGVPEIPEASTGQNGQAIVIESGSYALKYPLLLDPIATGYTVDNTMEIANATTGEYVVAMELNATAKTASFKPITLDFDVVTNVPAGWTLVDSINATTQLATTGLYNWYFDVDATAKTITLKVDNMNPAKTLNTTLFNATPTPATPQQLIAANPKALRRTIQNDTNVDIVIGTQAQLTANAAQGFTIRNGYEYETESNGALFVLFPTGTTALAANQFVKIIEEVLV